MNTLRVKFALLLVIAIVSVVGLLTVVLFYLLGPPTRSERAIEGVVRQVEMVLKLTSSGLDGVTLADGPAGGRLYERTTEALRETLKKRGIDLPVTISRQGHHAPLIVSVPIGDKGWLWMPTSGMPPPGPPWKALFRWLMLIALGATVIAVFVANRMVRPLVFLENAVASVGADGMLPELPERGPAEVRATAKALNSLSTRLKRAMESRMRLVAAAGHDMRTPITRMRLRAEFVTDEDERGKWLNDLDELERIADSAIMLVREETGAAAPELVRLDELVSDIGADLREQNLDVTIEDVQPVTVRVSRFKLNRALRNLIINAATHGVRARVSVNAPNGPMARIVIADGGPGIPPAVIDQVFEPFFRADPARRQDIPGAGLGLTIARELVQRAGGNISIANGPGGGLVQVVELPKAVETEPA
ncbi:histidine kinase [Methyloceanibacter superfactus]|uniref:histidine kinase n=1 Tax=Methyloceanibacter superfactus TaxID=1774969 RepID=A0A1E3VT66_9HYPH|nr:HAMP domain-containing sensor histidine kinase [Methyloceanibacter superfactus]ODR96719.1 histidine kinase [Methyloceanibacter superfactus]